MNFLDGGGGGLLPILMLGGAIHNIIYWRKLVGSFTAIKLSSTEERGPWVTCGLPRGRQTTPLGLVAIWWMIVLPYVDLTVRSMFFRSSSCSHYALFQFVLSFEDFIKLAQNKRHALEIRRHESMFVCFLDVVFVVYLPAYLSVSSVYLCSSFLLFVSAFQ